MELHFLDERVARLESIRSETDCKSVSYLVDKIIQKLHDVTAVVFLLNHYSEGFLQEHVTQYQSQGGAQTHLLYENAEANQYNNTIQKMMWQISIDSLTLALKTLPDVINNDILACDIKKLNIDSINEKLSILIDLAQIEGDVPFHGSMSNNAWITPLVEHTEKKNQAIVDGLHNYSYALSMWLAASQNTLALLKEYRPFGMSAMKNKSIY